MPEGSDERRDSFALEPSLIYDAEEKARAEVRNGLRQYDADLASFRKPSIEARSGYVPR
jgi:hypothetical protein